PAYRGPARLCCVRASWSGLLGSATGRAVPGGGFGVYRQTGVGRKAARDGRPPGGGVMKACCAQGEVQVGRGGRSCGVRPLWGEPRPPGRGGRGCLRGGG